jgi:ABC-2 type transport system permease protein
MNPAPGSAPQIIDQGYRRYDGPRLGTTQSMKSLFKQSLQRALGLKRPFRFKIVPFLTAFLAYLPAIVVAGVSILFSGLADDDDGATYDYAGYYSWITLVIVLFCAFVGPELLVTDRRTGMLGMYLASPLTRFRYIATKLFSVLTVLLVVTLGPTLLLLIAYTALGEGPNGFSDWMLTLGRILLVGVLVSLFFSSISMAVSAVAKRNGFAGAGIAMLFIGSAVVSALLVGAAGLGDWLFAFNLLALPFDVAGRIFGESENNLEDVNTFTSVAVFTGIIVLSLGVVWDRYFRLEVTK